MIGYQVYAKCCKKNTQIHGLENKGYADDIKDYSEDHTVQIKHENKCWHLKDILNFVIKKFIWEK